MPISGCSKKGDYASRHTKQFTGLKVKCALMGAKAYDRLVAYCSIKGTDFGRFIMQNPAYKVWEKFDVWDRY